MRTKRRAGVLFTGSPCVATNLLLGFHYLVRHSVSVERFPMLAWVKSPPKKRLSATTSFSTGPTPPTAALTSKGRLAPRANGLGGMGLPATARSVPQGALPVGPSSIGEKPA